MTARPIIALLSDFGTADWFVGSMKAAILSRLPDCAIVDLCHTLEPGEVAAGGWILEKTFRDFPRKTVFCAVVDPGVGTERRAIAAESGDFFFVAPDNGLLSAVLERAVQWQCREITNPAWMNPAPSRTFHGRDIFAPAAARLALEGGIENAGEAIADPVTIELPATVVRTDGSVEGTIVHFDRFGNAITSIERAAAEKAGATAAWRVWLEDLTIPRLSDTYADVAMGEPLAYWGSLATLEIAVRGGSARNSVGLRTGAGVRLVPS